MAETELAHYGIKGMKWGVRRTEAQLARARGASPKSNTKKNVSKKAATKSATSETPKKTVKEMSDDELREKISRLELEKRYKDLSKSTEAPKVNKGREFVARVIERSGENIATQLTTYMMGKAVNKAFSDIFKEDIVNPKKGQKDK